MTASTLAESQSAAFAANFAGIRARMAAAAERASRDAAAVRLVGVSKTVSAELCATAVRAGLTDLGENRVQEGTAKVDALRGAGLRPTWHLIGHLQRNKVAAATAAFDVIQSVDSDRLAQAISDQAREPRVILLEVNIAGEPRKTGFSPSALDRAYDQIRGLPNLQVRGLMTVAPLVDDAEQARPCFRHLRRLADSLGLAECSMGMSNDFEVAVEEGATIVRVGRALFGARPTTGGPV